MIEKKKNALPVLWNGDLFSKNLIFLKDPNYCIVNCVTFVLREEIIYLLRVLNTFFSQINSVMNLFI